MKKYIFLLLIIFNVSALIAQNIEWVKVKDTVSAYSIEFPTTPKKGVQDVSTNKGTVAMHSYTLQTQNDENVIYMTSFTTYPESFFKEGLDTFEIQNKVLNNSVDGAVANTKGKLLVDKKITFNGYNGRDVKIEISGLYIIRMRTVLVGYKLYLAQVIYDKVHDENENSKRFFESFELINVKQ